MSRNPGFVFGVLLAVVISVLQLSLGWPMGAAVFAVAIGILGLLRSWLVWTRLGLRWTSLGMAGSGGSLVALGILLLKDPELTSPVIPLVVGLLVASVLLLFVDRRAHPDAWRRWEEAIRGSSPFSILLGTDLPKAKRGR